MGGYLSNSISMFKRVTRWLSVLSTLCLVALMLINVIDIVGAKWLHISVPGTIDISEELMVFIVMLPITYIELERGHIVITLLLDRMGKGWSYAVQIIKYLVGTLVMAFFTWRVFVQLQHTISIMELKIGIHLPIWPANLAIVIAFGLLTIVWLLLLIKTLTGGLEEAN